jgi:beta-phosphoglucomutase-like phosphatase (HAD superfamily)
MKQLVVLWDMDGTLVDSEPLNIEKNIVLAARHGVTLTADHFKQPQSFMIPDGHGGMKSAQMPLGGAGDKNIYYWLITQKPELAASLSWDAWLGEILDYYMAQAATIKTRAGILDVVRDLHQRGAIQGVVTSGLSRQVQANLRALEEAASHMVFVLTADDVKISKPDPEGYKIGMQRAADYARAKGSAGNGLVYIAVEDSEAGTRAALAAGIFCIQFLLPGITPFVPPAEHTPHFRLAHTSADVAQHIDTILSAA